MGAHEALRGPIGLVEADVLGGETSVGSPWRAWGGLDLESCMEMGLPRPCPCV